MKLTHKVCGAALLAVIGVAVAGPGVTQTKAAPDHTWTGDGQISFTGEDYSKNTDGTNVPDTTDTFTGSVTNGEFVVRAVTPLDFGTAEATVGSEITAWAKPYNGSEGEDVPNFVRFKDNRVQETHTHELSAQITEQFKTSANKTLTGATIIYNHGRILDAKNGSQMPAPANQTVSSKEINTTGRTAVYTNSDGTVGRGDFFLAFGKVGDTNLPIDQAVQLKIPSTVNDITTDTYRATITWTLSETPL